jgi:hypothetical protein
MDCPILKELAALRKKLREAKKEKVSLRKVIRQLLKDLGKD